MAANASPVTMNTICTSARVVARFLISLQGEDGMNAHTLTNMRLQKILYFAQGFALGSIGIPLFDDPFHALPYGPVCLDIYGMLKQYRNGQIPMKEGCGYIQSLVKTFNIVEYLRVVMKWANQLSTPDLVRRSHIKDSPWEKVWSPDSAFNTRPYNEIPQDVMKVYFSKFFHS